MSRSALAVTEWDANGDVLAAALTDTCLPERTAARLALRNALCHDPGVEPVVAHVLSLHAALASADGDAH